MHDQSKKGKEMKQDTKKTKVIFRKYKEGDVIALFPEIADSPDPSYCSSYQHIGQHGAADPLIINETKRATPKEFAALKKELESLGYNLQVISRNRAEFYGTRKKSFQAYVKEHSKI